MKATLFFAVAAAFFLICSPLFLISEKMTFVNAPAYEENAALPAASAGKRQFRIKTGGKIVKLSADEYITGVLCGEVSPAYSKEALKAQAVAAYTFACRRAAFAESINREYDLTDDPATDQCYVSKAEIKQKWGEKADEYYSALESAVKEVSGEWLCYDGGIALTVYHAISPGATNSSQDVWGNALPYLVSVESIGDRLAAGYLSETDFTEAELMGKLAGICEPTAGQNVFEDIKKNESGLVLSLKAGGKTVSGADIASALLLPSAAFEVEYQNGKYHFTVYGKGHGVGMSQTGAEYMARQGSDYKEILFHYYKGCEIKKS